MTSYVTINGHTYSDAQDDGGSGIRFLGNGGHRTNLMLLVEDVILATDALNTDITALQTLKFLNATNRLAGLEYIDSTHTAVAHTFTSASIGQRGYDMDTKTFWDVSDVVLGVPVLVGTQSEVSTLSASVEGLSTSHYEAVVVPGFNTDVQYLTSTSLVPNFVCTADGDVIYARNSNAA